MARATKPAEETSTNSEVVTIDSWVADNYEELVADENRTVTYKSIEKDAEAAGDPNLAAWARSRAAGKGKDVTPKDAESAPKTVTRELFDGKHEAKDVEVKTTDPDVIAAAAIADSDSDK